MGQLRDSSVESPRIFPALSQIKIIALDLRRFVPEISGHFFDGLFAPIISAGAVFQGQLKLLKVPNYSYLLLSRPFIEYGRLLLLCSG